MINADFRLYDFFTFGDSNAYGQPQLSQTPQGQIKIAIYTSSQNIQDNIRYKDCIYIGLTHDAKVNDTYVIQYGTEQLKVLYVNTSGTYKQVFLKNL